MIKLRSTVGLRHSENIYVTLASVNIEEREQLHGHEVVVDLGAALGSKSCCVRGKKARSNPKHKHRVECIQWICS